jgi:hypothetical protein
MKALAVDIGGTHVTCGLVEDRQLLAWETCPANSASTLASVLPVIAATFESLTRRTSLALEDF